VKAGIQALFKLPASYAGCRANTPELKGENQVRTLSMVMNSDQVNRYGTRLPLETLLSVLRQAREGAPMFISHDMRRPIGCLTASVRLPSCQVSRV
jgi:hypothetical protein